jgi:hypothetical protein
MIILGRDKKEELKPGVTREVLATQILECNCYRLSSHVDAVSSKPFTKYVMT